MLLTEAELEIFAGVHPADITEADLRAEQGVDVAAAKLDCEQRKAAARQACAALEAESGRLWPAVDLSGPLADDMAVLRRDAERVLQSSGAEVVAAWERSVRLLKEERNLQERREREERERLEREERERLEREEQERRKRAAAERAAVHEMVASMAGEDAVRTPPWVSSALVREGSGAVPSSLLCHFLIPQLLLPLLARPLANIRDKLSPPCYVARCLRSRGTQPVVDAARNAEPPVSRAELTRLAAHPNKTRLVQRLGTNVIPKDWVAIRDGCARRARAERVRTRVNRAAAVFVAALAVGLVAVPWAAGAWLPEPPHRQLLAFAIGLCAAAACVRHQASFRLRTVGLRTAAYCSPCWLLLCPLHVDHRSGGCGSKSPSPKPGPWLHSCNC
eukprot:SAG31_NODE_6451_length_2013_cov_5.095089_2_plen_391_part_00